MDIEFARLSDAAQAAMSHGQGNLKNITDIDEAIDRHSGNEFFSNYSTATLIKKINGGDQVMTELVEGIRSKIAEEIPVPTENRRRVRRGRDCGDEINPDLFLDRVPEMWNRIEADATPARRVVVTINGSVSFKQKQDELGYRAAAAIAFADRLTEMGVSVEIRLMKCTMDWPTTEIERLTTTVIVKHSDQPMSIPDLATACCLIGAFRLSMIYGTIRYVPGNANVGLGTPESIPADRRVGDFIVDRDIDNQEKAVQWVQNSINQFAQSEVA
jgi:hypothetical protein